MKSDLIILSTMYDLILQKYTLPPFPLSHRTVPYSREKLDDSDSHSIYSKTKGTKKTYKPILITTSNLLLIIKITDFLKEIIGCKKGLTY